MSLYVVLYRVLPYCVGNTSNYKNWNCELFCFVFASACLFLSVCLTACLPICLLLFMCCLCCCFCCLCNIMISWFQYTYIAYRGVQKNYWCCIQTRTVSSIRPEFFQVLLLSALNLGGEGGEGGSRTLNCIFMYWKLGEKHVPKGSNLFHKNRGLVD